MLKSNMTSKRGTNRSNKNPGNPGQCTDKRRVCTKPPLSNERQEPLLSFTGILQARIRGINRILNLYTVNMSVFIGYVATGQQQ